MLPNLLFLIPNGDGLAPDLDRENGGAGAECISLKSRASIAKVIFHVHNKIDPSIGEHSSKLVFTYRGPPKLLSEFATPSPVESVKCAGPFRCSTFAADKSFGGGLSLFLAPDSTGDGVANSDKSFGGPRYR